MTTFFESLKGKKYPQQQARFRLSGKSAVEPAIFSGYLFAECRELGGSLKLGFYVLDKHHLHQYEDEGSKACLNSFAVEFCLMELLKAEDLDKNPRLFSINPYAIKLSLANDSLTLYALEEQDYSKWSEALSQVAVRNDFHERFEVVGRVGSGAFAKVFKAIERATFQAVAVKAFNKSCMGKQERAMLAICNEVMLLRSLQHQNIVNLHEVHESANSVYLILDYIGEGDLFCFVERGETLPEEDIVSLAKGLIGGLEELARQKIVHRDLKPANVLMRKQHNIRPEDVVIADFGLATVAGENDLIFTKCGTPGHIAPEILRSSHSALKPEVGSDCFGLGVILYMLTAGHNPFDVSNGNPSQILKKNFECNVTFPDAFEKNYSGKITSLIKGLLAADPAKRLQLREASAILSSESTQGGNFDELCDVEMPDDQTDLGTKIRDYNMKTLQTMEEKSMIIRRIDFFTSSIIACQSLGKFDKALSSKQRKLQKPCILKLEATSSLDDKQAGGFFEGEQDSVDREMLFSPGFTLKTVGPSKLSDKLIRLSPLASPRRICSRLKLTGRKPSPVGSQLLHKSDPTN